MNSFLNLVFLMQNDDPDTPVSHRTFNTICKYIGVDPAKARLDLEDWPEKQNLGEVGNSFILRREENQVGPLSGSVATSAVPSQHARYFDYCQSLQNTHSDFF